jgi:tetratricopeptide (TPR) repeat protein
MKKLIHEIHRRSLWQVLGLYLAGSWLALQVVETLTESAGLPAWVPAMALVLLVIGLPVVLGTAVVQEGVGSPESASPARPGDARPSEPSPGEPRPGVPSFSVPFASSSVRGLLTWRRAILGGVGALILLVLGVGGWIAMRSLGIGPAATLVAQGVLEERDRILLADFANRTTDSLLAGVVTEALRVDLAQSNIVRLAEQSTVSGALERMQRSPDDPLDHQLARLVAQREGFAAVLVGEVGEAGSGYVLSAQLLEPGGGDILVSHRETADDADDVIKAIDRLSTRVRERIGESLGSLRAAPPLERVTTSNLEALRLYSQAIRAIEVEGFADRGIQLLQEAISLDTAFAAAYRKIGVTLGNRFEEADRQIQVLQKAYQHRDRLSRPERFMTIAAYHSDVTGDRQQAIAAYENLLEFDPEFYPALNNLGIMYGAARDQERALDLYMRAARADSSSPFPYLNAVWVQLLLGRPEEARRSLFVVDSLFPGYPHAATSSGKMDALEGDYDAARAHFAQVGERLGADLFWKAETEGLLAQVDAIEGKLRQYEAHIRDRTAANESRGLPEEALSDAIFHAWVNLGSRRDTARGIALVEEALAGNPIEALPAADRPYLDLADFYAVTGRAREARALVEEYEREVPSRGRFGEYDLLRSQARIATAEGRHDEAIELVRRSDAGGCTFCPVPYLIDAFESAGMTDSVIPARERYLEMQFLDRLYWDGAFVAGTYERLGELYDARGDLDNAAKYYAMFVELWAEADEELQPRVRAAQARLEEILRERG